MRTILLALLLSGCAIPVSQKVISVEYVSADQLKRLCPTNAVACAHWEKQGGRCWVYILESVRENLHKELYVLGHETKHCFEGKWHP